MVNNMIDVVARAVEIFHDPDFRNSQAFPQNYDYEVYHFNVRMSYERWVWELAYCEARLERAEREGRAQKSPFGLIYTDYPEHVIRRMHNC